jgi:hypothetical protein
VMSRLAHEARLMQVAVEKKGKKKH